MVGDRTWIPQPVAEAALDSWLTTALSSNAAAAAYAMRLHTTAGVRLRDIVDHIAVAAAEQLREAEAVGWNEAEPGIWRNPDGMFPPLVRSTGDAVWLRVESAAVFVAANAPGTRIAGEAHAPLRQALAFPGEVEVGVIERNGVPGFTALPHDAAEIRNARVHLNAFRARRRQFDSVALGLVHTEALVDAAVADLGPHRACDLWLKAEREFWLGRCPAGRIQAARQNAAGIGWANIDHHTYDGSRAHFAATVRILEKLGYEVRELLYAGELAGWGSQVLEQPVIGSTIFADVDLAPEELAIDFAHQPLPELPRHKRAGLLSALLGESILEAGLNHVAALYDQRSLRAQLGERGLTMMAPFTDWPHLYQELTHGDWAAVDPARVDALQAAGHIGPKEAERLRLDGSIVTHLENIERNDGFKGFNRDGIDSVLRKLDPRAYLATA